MYHEEQSLAPHVKSDIVEMLNVGEKAEVARIPTRVPEEDSTSWKVEGGTVLREMEEGTSISIVGAGRFWRKKTTGVSTSAGTSATIVHFSSPSLGS